MFCLFVCFSFCLYAFCLTVCMSVCLSLCPICLSFSVCLPTVCLSLPVYLYLCLSVCLSFCLSVCLPLSVCICLSMCRILKSYVTLFWSLFGLTQLSAVREGRTQPFTKTVGEYMLMVYHAMAVIVLINMLIAMMSNSFQEIEVTFLTGTGPTVPLPLHPHVAFAVMLWSSVVWLPVCVLVCSSVYPFVYYSSSVTFCIKCLLIRFNIKCMLSV